MSSLDFDADTQVNAFTDAASEDLQRRWFAATSAVSEIRAECDLLRRSVEHTERIWRRANQRLQEFEALRDALGLKLGNVEAAAERRPAA